MAIRGGALRGGMPLYKFVGNRILTKLENALTGASLSEWHSGYRAYRVSSLQQLPLDSNSDGFDFDTQIIVQLIESGSRIVEIPIPTYYGDEISHVNGIQYAIDILRYVTTYRLHRIGFGSGELAFASGAYEEKFDDHSSHAEVLSMVDRPSLDVLDLGCGSGFLSQRLRNAGHRVVGVDIVELPEVHQRTDRFVLADLSRDWPDDLGRFDVVLAADVFEHLANPEEALRNIGGCLSSGGEILASIPNFAHWYPRIRVVIGRFGYDRRGILDRGHLRFFTRRSFTEMARRSGFIVQEVRGVGIPFEVGERSAGGTSAGQAGNGRIAGWVGSVDRWLCRLAPSLFAYQFIFRLQPRSTTADGIHSADQ
jgi:SAM-dependent methyltransferase